MKSLLISAIVLSFVFASCTKEKITPLSSSETKSLQISTSTKTERVSFSDDDAINAGKISSPVSVEKNNQTQVLRVKYVTGRER